MALTDSDLIQVKDYIVRLLPEVLEHNSYFGDMVYNIVTTRLSRPDEFARLLEQLDAYNEQYPFDFPKTHALMGQLVQRLDNLQADVTELQSGQEQLRAGQDELRAGQEQLRSDVTGLRAGQEQLRSDVTELRSDVTELRSDVTELRSDVTELRSDVTELRSDVTELRSDVTELRAGQEQLRQLIDDRTEMLRQELNRVVANLGQRWGLMTEDVLRQVVKG
jgi:chromosome segregation ATPase